MSIPAPIRFIEFALQRFRFPVITVGVLTSVPLVCLFYFLGAFSLDAMPWDRPMEFVGFFMLASLLPAYMLMCLIAWVRSSRSLFAGLEKEFLRTPSLIIERYRFAGYWPIAVVVGLLFAGLVNISWDYLEFNWESEIFVVSVTMVFGQALTWSMIALLIFLTLHEDYILYQYGKNVQVNLYDLDKLNGFGRAALNGFLMTVGALAFMTLQSLDQAFEWGNYANGLYVGVPAAIAFMLLPTWTVHRNIKAEKAKAIIEINSAIAVSSSELDVDSLTRLNGLMTRREQIAHLRTWPMDVSIFSRFLFYVFIPPLAWLGAALMEIMLDSFIAG